MERNSSVVVGTSVPNALSDRMAMVVESIDRLMIRTSQTPLRNRRSIQTPLRNERTRQTPLWNERTRQTPLKCLRGTHRWERTYQANSIENGPTRQTARGEGSHGAFFSNNIFLHFIITLCFVVAIVVWSPFLQSLVLRLLL